jgi:hypothetical protein
MLHFRQTLQMNKRAPELRHRAHRAYETADDANAWHRLRRVEVIGILSGIAYFFLK